MAVACDAVRYGWTFDDFEDALFDPANALAERVLEMAERSGDAATTKYLEREWRQAQAHVGSSMDGNPDTRRAVAELRRRLLGGGA